MGKGIIDLPLTVDKTRVRALNSRSPVDGPVVYWMSRDQRVNDNWALLFAQELALQRKQALRVIFCLAPQFLGATLPHYRFMLKGLAEVEKELPRLNIAFQLLSGEPGREIPAFLDATRAGALVADFSPLNINRKWKEQVAKECRVAAYEVDAHNIVPCWQASAKQEHAAYTIRPKIKRQLPAYLTDLPRLIKHPFGNPAPGVLTDWAKAEMELSISENVGETSCFVPGEAAAGRAMNSFMEDRLPGYNLRRNDPTVDGQSDLSPYLHFGQLSAQRLALEVSAKAGNTPSGQDFLEELIVRRELADNFCFYNQDYDSQEAFPRWARETLAAHLADRREYLYSLEQFAAAATHDQLWNAAQAEMMKKGKMHGYLRMYWAKKILEWSETPRQALETAIYLNDRFSLDGRDPNGYAGIAWSIGGVHDRAWPERPIFGKIRYMSYKGSRSKFNVEGYMARVNQL